MTTARRTKPSAVASTANANTRESRACVAVCQSKPVSFWLICFRAEQAPRRRRSRVHRDKSRPDGMGTAAAAASASLDLEGL
jgi:hypothetical protein